MLWPTPRKNSTSSSEKISKIRNLVKINSFLVMKWMSSSLILESFEKWWHFKKINGIFHTLIEFKLLNVLQGKISYSRTVRTWLKQIFHIKLKKINYCYLSEKCNKTQNVEYLFMLTGNCCFYFFKMTLFWCRFNWYMTWTCSFKCTICSIFPHCEGIS